MTELTTQPTEASAASPADATRNPAEPCTAQPTARELVEADLLVEDVSIDGMCGVY